MTSRTKKSTVVYAKEPLVKLPRVVLLPKVRFAILALIACLFVGIIMLAQKKWQPKTTPTVMVNGQEVNAAFLTPEFKVKDVPSQPTDYPKLASELEAKIASGQASVEDHVNLGHLYLKIGNKTKALENYRTAKQLADPKMPNYQSFQEAMDQAIKQIEGSS